MIRTPCIFRNKVDEDGNFLRNKSIFVAKGYNQEEDIDFDENHVIVAWLEAIKMLLALSFIMNFKLFQMNVNSALLNYYIQEEVFVDQPSGFINWIFLNIVFILKKDLYSLWQASIAW